jgi:hypothetical protein
MSIKSTDDIINKEVKQVVEQIFMHCTPDDDFWEIVPLLVKLCCQKVLSRYLALDLKQLSDKLEKLNKGDKT